MPPAPGPWQVGPRSVPMKGPPLGRISIAMLASSSRDEVITPHQRVMADRPKAKRGEFP